MNLTCDIEQGCREFRALVNGLKIKLETCLEARETDAGHAVTIKALAGEVSPHDEYEGQLITDFAGADGETADVAILSESTGQKIHLGPCVVQSYEVLADDGSGDSTVILKLHSL